MRAQRTRPIVRTRLDARQVWFHRRQIAAGLALALTVGVLVVATPWLLTLALVERHQTRRKTRLLGLIVLAALAQAVGWLWHELWRHPLEPCGPWHPCQHCGFPITDKSRARYCSPGCRRLARLTVRARSDDRAASRLARLQQSAPSYDPATSEIPF
jgi:hypothetical protein